MLFHSTCLHKQSKFTLSVRYIKTSSLNNNQILHKLVTCTCTCPSTNEYTVLPLTTCTMLNGGGGRDTENGMVATQHTYVHVHAYIMYVCSSYSAPLIYNTVYISWCTYTNVDVGICDSSSILKNNRHLHVYMYTMSCGIIEL